MNTTDHRQEILSHIGSTRLYSGQEVRDIIDDLDFLPSLATINAVLSVIRESGGAVSISDEQIYDRLCRR